MPLAAAGNGLFGGKPPLRASHAVQKPASVQLEIITGGGRGFRRSKL